MIRGSVLSPFHAASSFAPMKHEGSAILNTSIVNIRFYINI